MSQATHQALAKGKFTLYGFKAVQAFPNTGGPVVWVRNQNPNNSMQVSWDTNFQAYTSPSSISRGTTVQISFTAPIQLGQTLQVQSNGQGSVAGGTPNIIAITGQSSTGTFACGVTQQVNGSQAPICAMPLLGATTVQITPIDKVLLTFATASLQVGTITMESPAAGGLIDLGTNSSAAVSFDINNGWSGNGVTAVASGANLVPLLIERQAD